MVFVGVIVISRKVLNSNVTRGRFFCHGLLRSHEIAIAPISRDKRTVPLARCTVSDCTVMSLFVVVTKSI